MFESKVHVPSQKHFHQYEQIPYSTYMNIKFHEINPEKLFGYKFSGNKVPGCHFANNNNT